MKLLYPLAKRFIAGYDFNSAKKNIDGLLREGYEVSIDYLGELSESEDDCIIAKNQYLHILDIYKDKKIDISIKPTQLGLLIDRERALSSLLDIVIRANEYDHTVRIDMEDSRVTQETIGLCMEIFNSWKVGYAIYLGDMPFIDAKAAGIALQANLFRTSEDINKFIKTKAVSIRLVKGAYKEDSKIAHKKENEIRSCFFDYAARLRASKAVTPAIATHDESLLDDINELIPDANTFFDYEFLYGIRRDLQKKYKKDGKRVRIYVPFGKDWFPYVFRRLREWKNLKFIIKNIYKEWKNE
jgi:proline dehydrogenase